MEREWCCGGVKRSVGMCGEVKSECGSVGICGRGEERVWKCVEA